MISLQSRLNRGLAAILCTIFTAHWLAADWVIRSVAEKQMMTRLEHDGDSLLDTLKPNANGRLDFDTTHVGSVYGQAFSGHYFVLYVDDRVHYSQSLDGVELPLPPVTPQTRHQYHFNDGPQQQPLLVLSRGMDKFGHHVSISVAEDLTDIGQDIDQIRLAYLGLTFIVLLAAIGLQTSDVKRSLRPLKAVRNELAEIANGQQQQIKSQVPTEIKPLVEEVNRLLLLVERRLYQSRTAIGNLAHALKTPLAIMFRLAENPTLEQHPEYQELLKTQTAAMHQRIERELKRARISGNIQTGASFNPYHELLALSSLLRNVYTDKQLIICVDAPDQLLHFDREDMLELTGNLLDNACKWAQKNIIVAVERRQEMIISVDDDGPGCSEECMQSLTQRGLRLDEAVQGHGLGLAIVRDIAECYGGTLKICRSTQLGGLRVEVRFST